MGYRTTCHYYILKSLFRNYIGKSSWRSCWYNSSCNNNFFIIRWPHHHSNAPSHQIIGATLGQFITYYRICNTVNPFNVAATNLILRILYRRHFCTAIILSWKRFISKQNNSKKINWKRIIKWFLCSNFNLNNLDFKFLVKYSIPANIFTYINIQTILQNILWWLQWCFYKWNWCYSQIYF